MPMRRMRASACGTWDWIRTRTCHFFRWEPMMSCGRLFRPAEWPRRFFRRRRLSLRAKRGMTFLVDLTDLKVEYQGSTITTRRSFIQRYPNLTYRTMRAIVRGAHLFKTRKEDTMRILGKFLDMKDREALEESWVYTAKMPAKPYAVENAVQSVINHLADNDPKFAKYKPAEFVDSDPLAELDKNSTIDRLYADVKGK